MLERYSHIRTGAKQAAIATLEQTAVAVGTADSTLDGAQNWAQSADTCSTRKKALI